MKKIILLALILSSCTLFEEPEFHIDPRLQNSFIAFRQEALKRGLDIDYSNLILQVDECSSTGLCSLDRGIFSNKQKTITINSALFKGDKAKIDSLALNYIVFHEFGHYVGRKHIETYSIMNVDNQINNAGDWHNDVAKRQILLEELFSSNE